MKELVIEHTSGEKANQREVFPTDQFPAVSIGRDLDFDIRFGDMSDQVSRQHARLIVDPSSDNHITVEDLGSRNGVFINGQKISGKAKLHHGDKVRLGTGGPEFTLRFNPEPKPQPKATREMRTPPPTAQHTTGGAPTTLHRSVPESAEQPRGVGHETVERMIAGHVEKQGNKSLTLVLVAVIAFLGLFGLGFYYYYQQTQKTKADLAELANKPAPVQPTKEGWARRVAGEYSDSVVYIEIAWHLVDAGTNLPLYHLFLPTDANKADSPAIPIYFLHPDNVLEPMLEAKNSGRSKLIGGRGAGTGFVANEDGFIITNRHVAASWKTAHAEFLQCPCAVFFEVDGQPQRKIFPAATPELAEAIRRWVPAKSRTLGRPVGGQNVTLDVTFNKSLARNSAKLVQVSDSHDVAMLKIDVPRKLKPIPLIESADDIPSEGEDAMTIGYPGVSPTVYYQIDSADPFNTGSSYSSKPAVSVTPGNVSRVLNNTDGKSISSMRDAYQLTINATGPGNSGGPVFNNNGRVFGIFFAGGNNMSYAVPIKYAKELLGQQ